MKKLILILIVVVSMFSCKEKVVYRTLRVECNILSTTNYTSGWVPPNELYISPSYMYDDGDDFREENFSLTLGWYEKWGVVDNIVMEQGSNFEVFHAQSTMYHNFEYEVLIFIDDEQVSYIHNNTNDEMLSDSWGLGVDLSKSGKNTRTIFIIP